MGKTSQDFYKNPDKYLLKLENRITKYDNSLDRNLLRKAYYFSFNRHLFQLRDSGDPYAYHPYEVAKILAELKFDITSIATALLHDTVEDGVATNCEIEKSFGKEIGNLVQGVTKLSKIQLPDKEVREASNFSKFIIAVSEDIRVLLIKLADRLHNMRTISFVRDEKRRINIAKETLEVYAPLAGRVGFQLMREELEKLSFKQTNSLAYQSLKKRINFLNDKNKNFVKNTIENIKIILSSDFKKIRVSGREKKIYSTWKKMQSKSIALEKVSDIYAFRIITSSKDDCYKVLGRIHMEWPMVPERFKDFISTPKPNGYASIHTTVIGPDGVQMELQIRSLEMHKIAEYGVASHWMYKKMGNQFSKKELKESNNWFQDVIEIIKTAGGPRELMEHSRIEMYSDNVFCFTPKGDVISLIKGSSALDFAYAIHSTLGEKTIGVKINGNLSPLNRIVSNGDQIEVLISKGQKPQPNWLNFCITGKARSQIRKSLRDHEKDEFEKLGKEILKKILLDVNKRATKKTLSMLVNVFNYNSYRSFYIALGRGEINSSLIMETFLPRVNENSENIQKVKNRLPIIGLTKGQAVNFAECCNPLPGENIVGILTEKKGINVHLINCSVLERFTDFPELWYELTWNTKSGKYLHTARLSLIVQNKIGSLNKITSCISKLNANIVDIKINKREEDFFYMEVDVQVMDSKHFNDLFVSLKLEDAIYKIERI